MNPYLVLNVPVTASDSEIRSAWLSAIQAAPPERDAVRFQAVQEAYTAIKDARSRARWEVFHEIPAADSPAAILAAHLALSGQVRLPERSAFLTYLQACVNVS